MSGREHMPAGAGWVACRRQPVGRDERERTRQPERSGGTSQPKRSGATTAADSPARVRRSRINLQDFQDLRECAEFETSLQPVPPASKPSLPEAAELLLAAMLGHIGEAVCGESLLNFSGLRAGVPQVSPQGGASRLGAAAPFVSIGRGAAPSGPLTSGNAITASRRQWRASPQGVGRRRRTVPTPEKGGTSRLGAAAPFVSMGRGTAPSGPLTSGNAITASRRQGWRASPRGVGRRRRAVPTPEKGGTSRLNLGSAQRAAPTL